MNRRAAFVCTLGLGLWLCGTAFAQTNVAPAGATYGWTGMTSSTANTGQVARPGLNDNNLTANVPLASTDATSAWEAAGVIWSTAPSSISSVKLINGDITPGGDGFLEANLKLQWTTDGVTWTDSGWTSSPAYPYTSAAGGQTYTFTGATVSGRRGARVVGQVRTVGNSYYWIVKEVQVMGTVATATNLALNKPATASSSESAATPPGSAVDGNTGTRWSSAFADPQWIRVDLGATAAISRVRLNWEAAYGKSYQIQTSNDDAAWTTLYSTTAGDGGIDDITVLSGSGRYLRMYGTTRGTAYGYSLWEMEVYGTGGGGPTATATATTRATATPTAAATATPTATTATGAANRSFSIPVGIENVNDSPLKAAGYRALLRFVPDSTISIDRMYFGYKVRGASCWDAGLAGYGAGDGGLLRGDLVQINPSTGVPGAVIASETVNGCTRHTQAQGEAGGLIPVLAWVTTPATLQAGTMYGLVVYNVHASPAANFFSFNAPLADVTLAGPHARNEMSASASGGILSLDPREHVAWSENSGSTWNYGFYNGQYRSYMNDHDAAHPATRMPQYGFRLTNGQTLGVQPYYAYSVDCTGCTVAYANARYARTFTEVGGFTASGTNVGTLTFKNTSTGAQSSCTPAQGYGFRKCTLPTAIAVAVGQSYTVSATGTVETMEMDGSQRSLFPQVGTTTGNIRTYQPSPAAGTDAKDVPSLWAGPRSANYP